MHLVCVGALKRLLELVLTGPMKVRLGRKRRLELSRRMICLKSQTTTEFQRKPRSTDYLAKWKVTEFWLFLLFCGPIVLRKLLPQVHLTMLYFCRMGLLWRLRRFIVKADSNNYFTWKARFGKKKDIYQYPLKSKVDVWQIPKQISKEAIYPLASVERKLVQLNLSSKPGGQLIPYVIALLHIWDWQFKWKLLQVMYKCI